MPDAPHSSLGTGSNPHSHSSVGTGSNPHSHAAFGGVESCISNGVRDIDPVKMKIDLPYHTSQPPSQPLHCLSSEGTPSATTSAPQLPADFLVSPLKVRRQPPQALLSFLLTSLSLLCRPALMSRQRSKGCTQVQAEVRDEPLVPLTMPMTKNEAAAGNGVTSTSEIPLCGSASSSHPDASNKRWGGMYSSGMYSSGMCSSGMCSSGMCSSGMYSSGMCSSGMYSSGMYSSGTRTAVECTAVECAAVECKAVECQIDSSGAVRPHSLDARTPGERVTRQNVNARSSDPGLHSVVDTSDPGLHSAVDTSDLDPGLHSAVDTSPAVPSVIIRERVPVAFSEDESNLSAIKELSKLSAPPAQYPSVATWFSATSHAADLVYKCIMGLKMPCVLEPGAALRSLIRRDHVD
ncbi:hypothetical protein CEUSTIGMA_g4219.t1 [Chlamydomonas eustigma]|uniref:Uncharacterized protein n=1 Tax=Chlamydomonas eustigma TaxID=1157962 RepID=A0A250X117_9CHLO|nr:hypothetical protein CEUSTIGMA_g4219.t1 [Chlamydomonas eustigma]|eukprot:GAX76773.1 hypothetical protein CEUSTIGMA_g4219.t1 [Chlamydomonas eustigma]